MVKRLSRESRLAIDTESNSLHAYREQVCLIQFSIPNSDFLVDPLAITDLSTLDVLFSDQRIEKTFHAAEYDLICLNRDYKFKVNHIFDTMQAARILGYPAVGLNNLLIEKFGINLDKRFQKADWAKRPLPADQLNYARMDTHYLLALRDSLHKELLTKDLWELACEDFYRISNMIGTSEEDSESWQRINGAIRLNSQQLAVFNELLRWRKHQAERMNRPVFKVVGDKLLVSVAESTPKKMDDLMGLNFTTRQSDLFGKEIMACVKRGLKAPPIKRKKLPRPNQALLKRMDTLRKWRKEVAVQIGVESDVILPRAYMQTIAEQNPKSIHDLRELLPYSPWRLNRYGRQILASLTDL